LSTTVEGLTDDEFIARFEDCSLEPELFHHREHIRVARIYLLKCGPIEGLARVCNGIRRYASSLGKADRYHETITWAYVLLVQERISAASPDQTWSEFVAANDDLLDWRRSILGKYYRDETLRSDRARRVFLLPDRGVE
jgi:hypothetical protein